MLQVEFLRQTGFLDEGVFLYGEEPILAGQVKRSGMKLFYDASVMAIHNHRENQKPPSRFQIKHWRHSQLYSLRKYNDYPWYGLWIAYLSICLKFFALDIYHLAKATVHGQNQ